MTKAQLLTRERLNASHYENIRRPQNWQNNFMPQPSGYHSSSSNQGPGPGRGGTESNPTTHDSPPDSSQHNFRHNSSPTSTLHTNFRSENHTKPQKFDLYHNFYQKLLQQNGLRIIQPENYFNSNPKNSIQNHNHQKFSSNPTNGLISHPVSQGIGLGRLPNFSSSSNLNFSENTRNTSSSTSHYHASSSSSSSKIPEIVCQYCHKNFKVNNEQALNTHVNSVSHKKIKNKTDFENELRQCKKSIKSNFSLDALQNHKINHFKKGMLVDRLAENQDFQEILNRDLQHTSNLITKSSDSGHGSNHSIESSTSQSTGCSSSTGNSSNKSTHCSVYQDRKLMTMKNQLLRESKFVAVRKYIQNKLPTLSMFMYGSSVTGIGFADSDVNIWLDGKIPTGENEESKHTLTHIKELFQPLKIYGFQVIEDTANKYPCILVDIPNDFDFESATPQLSQSQNCLQFRFATDGIFSTRVAYYIQEYYKYSNLIKPLSIILRCLFAHPLKLDSSTTGFLPPHAYSFLVIFYLQMKGMLPVLEFVSKEPDSETPKDHVYRPEDDNGSDSESDDDVFVHRITVRGYPEDLQSDHKLKQAHQLRKELKKLKKSDSSSENEIQEKSQLVKELSKEIKLKRLILKFKVNIQEWRRDFQKTLTAIQYSAYAEKYKNINDGLNEFYDLAGNQPIYLDLNNNEGLYEEMKKLLRFYLTEFRIDDHAVQIHQVHSRLRTTSEYRNKKFASKAKPKGWFIEDIPANKSQNIAKCMVGSATTEYLTERLRDFYYYMYSDGTSRYEKGEINLNNLNKQVEGLNWMREIAFFLHFGPRLDYWSSLSKLKKFHFWTLTYLRKPRVMPS